MAVSKEDFLEIQDMIEIKVQNDFGNKWTILMINSFKISKANNHLMFRVLPF